MSILSHISMPAAGKSPVESALTQLRKKDIGVLPATAQTVKLIIGGVAQTAGATVTASVKFLNATLQKIVFMPYCVFGNDVHYAVNKSMSIDRTFDEAHAEASKALKTIALLSVAFAGPICPQWVAKAAVKLGLSRGDESLFRRFVNGAHSAWNSHGNKVASATVATLGVATVGMAVYLLSTGVKQFHMDFLSPMMESCKPVLENSKNWAEMSSEEQGNCVGAIARVTRTAADRLFSLGNLLWVTRK